MGFFGEESPNVVIFANGGVIFKTPWTGEYLVVSQIR